MRFVPIQRVRSAQFLNTYSIDIERMSSTSQTEESPDRLTLVAWTIAPIYTVLVAWMIPQAETALMLVLWLAVLGMGLRDTYNLVRYHLT